MVLSVGCDLIAVCVECLVDLEDGKHTGDGEPHRVQRQEPSRTDATAEAKGRNSRIADRGIERAIFGKETLGFVCLGVGEMRLVV